MPTETASVLRSRAASRPRPPSVRGGRKTVVSEATLDHPPIVAPLGAAATSRLELRRPVAEHLDGLAPVFAKTEVWHYPYGRGFSRDETKGFLDREMRSWSTRGFGLWIAVERSTDRVIGFVGLSVPTFLPEILPAVEVGWRFDPNVWGKGYATEGARVALEEAFTTLGVAEVCSIVEVDNEASLRVAERAGLRRERTVELGETDQRGACHAALFLITRDRWTTTRS